MAIITKLKTKTILYGLLGAVTHAVDLEGNIYSPKIDMGLLKKGKDLPTYALTTANKDFQKYIDEFIEVENITKRYMDKYGYVIIDNILYIVWC